MEDLHAKRCLGWTDWRQAARELCPDKHGSLEGRELERRRRCASVSKRVHLPLMDRNIVYNCPLRLHEMHLDSGALNHHYDSKTSTEVLAQPNREKSQAHHCLEARVVLRADAAPLGMGNFGIDTQHRPFTFHTDEDLYENRQRNTRSLEANINPHRSMFTRANNRS